MTCCCTFLLVVFGTTLYMPLMNGDKNARKLFCALLLIPLSLLLGNIVIQSTSASTGHHQKLAEALSLTLLVVYMNVLEVFLQRLAWCLMGWDPVLDI